MPDDTVAPFEGNLGQTYWRTKALPVGEDPYHQDGDREVWEPFAAVRHQPNPPDGPWRLFILWRVKAWDPSP